MISMVRVLAVAVLLLMLGVTLQGFVDRGPVRALSELWTDPWYRATLADASCALLLLWLWIAWREHSVRAAALWFLLVLCCGSLAVAGYLLWRLRGVPGDAGLEVLFQRR